MENKQRNLRMFFSRACIEKTETAINIIESNWREADYTKGEE